MTPLAGPSPEKGIHFPGVLMLNVNAERERSVSNASAHNDSDIVIQQTSTMSKPVHGRGALKKPKGCMYIAIEKTYCIG